MAALGSLGFAAKSLQAGGQAAVKERDRARGERRAAQTSGLTNIPGKPSPTPVTAPLPTTLPEPAPVVVGGEDLTELERIERARGRAPTATTTLLGGTAGLATKTLLGQ